MTEYDIVSFGGIGDGVYDNSNAFQAALNTIKEAGGGVLRVGEGTWRTGPIEIYSHTTLVLDEGAVISLISEPARYPPVLTRWEGLECYAMHPCVFATGQEDIVIRGKGIIEGNGQYWWNKIREKNIGGQRQPQSPEELALSALNPGYENQPSGGGGRKNQFLRPPLVQFYNCSKMRLEGITLRNSPFWTLHPVYCTGIVISALSIINPPDAPNTDGMDIDSCEDVLIENCHISVGDDAIALKSGSGEDAVRAGRPSRRVTVRDCKVESGHGGIVIGSETAGGISEVLAENCLFRGTDRGIRIKTRRGRGGTVQDLEFRKLTMENNLCPLAINMYYRCGASLEDGYFSTEALPVSATTPAIRNIRIADIKATGCRASAGFIAGLPESPIEKISVTRCEFSTNERSGVSPDESDMFLGLPQVSEKSIRLLNVKDVQFSEVKVSGPAEAFIYR